MSFDKSLVEVLMSKVKIKKLHPEAKTPKYMTEGAAGMDLASVEDVLLQPGAFQRIRTGVAFALPPGIEAQVRSRSSLADKHGVAVLNSPGTVDSDYRGEVGVILVNHGHLPYHIKVGERIAQVVFAAYRTVTMEEVEELSATERGEGGFGSTGK